MRMESPGAAFEACGPGLRPRLERSFGAEYKLNSFIGSFADGAQVTHLAAFARFQLLVQVQADARDGEGFVEGDLAG